MGVLDDSMAEVDRAIRSELERQARFVLAESNLNVGHGDPSDDPDPAVSIIRSGKVDVDISLRTGEMTAVISYSTPYVVKQHESFHLRHPRGGGPRFLENALLARARSVENGVAATLRVVNSSGGQRPGRVREARA
jgi:hypothetical protein